MNRTVRSTIAVLFASLSLGLAACGDSDDGGGGGGGGNAGSCDKSDLGICYDYSGANYTPSIVMSACNGTYSASACATANRVGSCKLYSGMGTEQLVRYYSNKFDEAHAQTNCTAVGMGAPPSSYIPN